jgi:hypothetical protein
MKPTFFLLEQLYVRGGPSAIYDFATDYPSEFSEEWTVCETCSNSLDDPTTTPTFRTVCAVCFTPKGDKK